MLRKIIFFLCLMLAASHINAWGSGVEKQVSISDTTITVRAALYELERQTGYSIGYNEATLDAGKKVSVNLHNTKLDEALNAILKDTGCSYTIKGNHVLIVKNQAGKQTAATTASEDKITVNGTVLDHTNEPLIGVSVVEKGTTNGTMTNVDGQFSLQVSKGTVLVVSYLGFLPQELKTSKQTTFTVVLKEDSQVLEEVVVVGYGTQKKVNLTGAVDAIGSEHFKDKSMPNLGKGLQGVIPNLNISMTDGKPTSSGAYNIRGTTTLSTGGSQSALVLIDGVEGDPSLLNPNDIESISVLKDAASAAIYGARGVFGVVLITTKKASEGRVSVTYNGSYSINDQTVKPDMVTDGYTWASMFNEFFYNWKGYYPNGVNNNFAFSQSYLDELKKRQEDPSLPLIEVNPANGKYIYYGSTDWFEELYKSVNTGMEHSLSVSGTSDKMTYYISGRYFQQDGIFKHNSDDYEMYNLRAKQSINITKWLKMSNNFDYSVRRYNYPLTSMFEQGIWRNMADQAFPIAMLYNPDGTFTYHGAATVGDMINGHNKLREKKKRIRNTTDVDAEFFNKKLKVHGDLSFINENHINSRKLYPVSYSDTEGVINSTTGKNYFSKRKRDETYLATNIYAEYSETLGKHGMKVLAGYNYEMQDYDNLYVKRENLLSETSNDISQTTSLDNATIEGAGNRWVYSGAFFRLNYSYADRYLLEFNGRYDGSSNFPPNERWGFFPSISAAYRISEEPYFENLKSAFSNLKLRVSYGSLGNGNISPYSYIDTYTSHQSDRLINGVLPQSVRSPDVIPLSLTWEKATTFNVGLDVTTLNNRLSFTGDIYRRKTEDMFLPGEKLPSIYGGRAPYGNNGDLETRGWELSVEWRDKFTVASKPFSYNIKFTLADHKSKVLRYPNPAGLIDEYYAGKQVGDIWGLVTEGLFQSYDEIYNHADQSSILVSEKNQSMDWHPGDPKFKDLDGDGVVYAPGYDVATLDNHGDLTVIGNNTPRYRYGFNLGADWNNFSISAFFQGVGKRDWWFTREATYFWGMYNRPYGWLPTDVYNNYWTPERTDAYFPRPNGYAAYAKRSHLQAQTRYLQNAAYIRLKNLTISYTLPEQLTRKIGMQTARVYFTGHNLWTWSPMFKYTKNFDPEVIEGGDAAVNSGSGMGNTYPMLRTFTFGMSLNF